MDETLGGSKEARKAERERERERGWKEVGGERITVKLIAIYI